MSQLYTFVRREDGPNKPVYAAHINELQEALERLHRIFSKTGAYVAMLDDDVLLADAAGGAFTITLPVAATVPGKRLTIKRISASNNVTVDGDASETIDGATTKVLGSQWAFITVISNGTAWFIVATGGTVT